MIEMKVRKPMLNIKRIKSRNDGPYQVKQTVFCRFFEVKISVVLQTHCKRRLCLNL